jgi:cytochrome c peroxidase
MLELLWCLLERDDEVTLRTPGELRGIDKRLCWLCHVGEEMTVNGYHPVDSLKVPKFCGIRTFMRLPAVQTTEDVDVAIVGIPFDTGASYRTGQRFGPGAIRDISVMIRKHNRVLDISIFDHISGVDYGDINVD